MLEIFHELRKAYQCKSPGSPVPAGDASHIRSSDMLHVWSGSAESAANQGECHRTCFNTELLFRGEDTQEWSTNSSGSAGGPANVATRDFHFFRVKIL